MTDDGQYMREYVALCTWLSKVSPTVAATTVRVTSCGKCERYPSSKTCCRVVSVTSSADWRSEVTASSSKVMMRVLPVLLDADKVLGNQCLWEYGNINAYIMLQFKSYILTWTKLAIYSDVVNMQLPKCVFTMVNWDQLFLLAILCNVKPGVHLKFCILRNGG